MSLKRAIQQATRRTFKANKSMRKKIIFKRLGDETYNTTTKTVSRQDLGQKTIWGLLSSYTSKEVLAGIASPEDQRLTVEARSIDFIPQTEDELTMKNSLGEYETWRIVEVKTEMSDSIFILRINQK